MVEQNIPFSLPVFVIVVRQGGSAWENCSYQHDILVTGTTFIFFACLMAKVNHMT